MGRRRIRIACEPAGPALGLAGVALGTLVPAAVTSFAFVLPFVVRALRLEWRTIAGHIWLPAFAPAVAPALALWIMDRPGIVPTPVALISQLCVAAGLYAAGYLVMPPATAERQLLADLFTVSRRRFAILTARG